MSRVAHTIRGVPEPAEKPKFNRRAFVLEVGRCQNPFCPIKGFPLACHEMTNGPNRKRALHVRAAILVLCSVCNCGDFHNRKLWPLPRQLALKLLVDSEYFSLDEINRLLAPEGHPNPPRVVEMKDVVRYLTLEN